MFEKNLSGNSIREALFTRKRMGLGLGILAVTIISYYLITQIFDAFKANDRVSEAVDKVHSLEVKNKELKEQLKEVASLEFIEKQARDKLGLAREGETIVIIPDDRLKSILGSEIKTEEARLTNWKGWLGLFF